MFALGMKNWYFFSIRVNVYRIVPFALTLLVDQGPEVSKYTTSHFLNLGINTESSLRRLLEARQIGQL
jgi:hypothetical protein